MEAILMTKKSKCLLSIILSIVLIFSFYLTGCSQVDAADTLIYAKVITDAEKGECAEAVAIKDGKIAYVGSQSEAEKYANDKTQIIDQKDNYIMPGFVDGHNHIYASSENESFDFRLENQTSVDEYLSTIRQVISQNPKDFYTGVGWEDSFFENNCPTADLLDKICPDIPIFIKSLDCHSCWINSAMMKRCGITKETATPVGGVIEKYSNGEPNGCFRDTAMDQLVRPYVPLLSVEQYKELLSEQQKQFVSLGYTTYNDVLIDAYSIDNIVKAYHELDEENKLLCYTNISCVVDNSDKIEEDICHYKDLAQNYNGNHVAIADVKFFVDGIYESHTAMVDEAYLHEPNNFGRDRWPGEEGTQRLNEAAELANNLGLNAHFHAIGEAAVGKALDAIEYAKEHSFRNDMRNVITHIENIRNEDIQRMVKLNVIASCNLAWTALYNGDVIYYESGDEKAKDNYEDSEITAVGEARFGNFYRYKSLVNAGVVCAFATDYPASTDVDPYQSIQTGVTRMYYNVKSSLLNPSEKLTQSEAVKMITENGAYQLGRENQIGKIAPGYQANLILVNNNLLTMDPTTIEEQAKTLATWVDGKMVFESK